MKAILINSAEQTVTEVDYDGDFRKLQKLIGCDCFTLAPLNPDNVADDVSLFVDDEGLLTGPEWFFNIRGVTYQPLAGNGVILGADLETGESIDAPLDVEDIQKRIQFFDKLKISLMAQMGFFG